MNNKPQDLKPRTKEFALRVIRMYSKLPKSDTVAQVLGNCMLFARLAAGHLAERHRTADLMT
jgi:hypothetical protein